MQYWWLCCGSDERGYGAVEGGPLGAIQQLLRTIENHTAPFETVAE